MLSFTNQDMFLELNSEQIGGSNLFDYNTR